MVLSRSDFIRGAIECFHLGVSIYLQDDIGTLEDSLKLLVEGLGRPICDVVLHFLPELESCVMLELLAGSVSNEAV